MLSLFDLYSTLQNDTVKTSILIESSLSSLTTVVISISSKLSVSYNNLVSVCLSVCHTCSYLMLLLHFRNTNVSRRLSDIRAVWSEQQSTLGAEPLKSTITDVAGVHRSRPTLNSSPSLLNRWKFISK